MLKYVRFLHATEGEVIAFTFAPLSHRDLAVAMRSQGYQPASAGFVSFDADGTARVTGESVSLRLKPDLGDAGRIGTAYRATAMMNAVVPTVVPPLPEIEIESTPRGCLICSQPILDGESTYTHSALGAPAYGREGMKSHLRCVNAQEAAFESNPRRG
jgi:hypothetical protein